MGKRYIVAEGGSVLCCPDRSIWPEADFQLPKERKVSRPQAQPEPRLLNQSLKRQTLPVPADSST